MGLFSFGKKEVRSVALIDIGSASVGGAYAHYEEGKQPVIYYTARVAVESREGENIRESMLRALAHLERRLTQEGAPALRRETGSGVIEGVLVSVAAPWQETVVATVHINERNPFVFTHAHLEAAFKKTTSTSIDRVLSDQTVVATILNGYETSNPFGKRATRAQLVLLTSTLERETAQSVELSLRRAFHTDSIVSTAFGPAAYTVFRDLYPHQKDFIVLDVSGAGSDLIVVKNGLLVEIRAMTHGARDISTQGQYGHPMDDREEEKLWTKELCSTFADIKESYPLPQMLFLLSDDDVRSVVQEALAEKRVLAHWPADEQPSVISVTPSNVASRVRTRGLGEGDVFLAILALYAARVTGDSAPVR